MYVSTSSRLKTDYAIRGPRGRFVSHPIDVLYGRGKIAKYFPSNSLNRTFDQFRAVYVDQKARRMLDEIEYCEASIDLKDIFRSLGGYFGMYGLNLLYLERPTGGNVLSSDLLLLCQVPLIRLARQRLGQSVQLLDTAQHSLTEELCQHFRRLGF